MISFLFLSAIAALEQNAKIPAKCSTSKSTRGFEIELWQEAAPQALKNDGVGFSNFLNQMVDFACEKQFDRILTTIQDPMQWKSGTVGHYANVLHRLPEYMTMGVLINANPKYPWVWKTDLPNPKGYDSSLLQAITFVDEVNKAAQALGATKKIMILGDDGENNGTDAANFCSWREIAFDVMKDDVYAGDIKFLQGKQGSLTAPALHQGAVDAYKRTYGKEPTNCGTYDNFLARAELFWYMDELKQKGCIGCPVSTPLEFTKPEQCTDDQGKLCSENPACASFNSFYTNGDVYDQCHAQADTGCPLSCCKCFGCVPCGYDVNGNAPNPAIMYQANRTNPAGMKDALIQGMLRTNIDQTIDAPNTAPMVSIEMAHNLYPDAVQAAGPNNSPNTCINRHFSASDGYDICGTFDGLGSMTFEDLLETFRLLNLDKPEMNVFTVYEWAFVPLSWIKPSESIIIS